MPSSTAARRYAAALFALAKEDSRVAEVREELDRLAALLDENEELRGALLTPLHPVEERKAVLLAVSERISMSAVMRNFCAFLVDRRRLVAFDDIREEYERRADEDSGLVIAEVIAASELDQRRRDRLRRALTERTGREVKLEIEVDPSLIGGAIAKIGDLVFDGSIRTQLAQLGANLTKGS